MIYQTVLHFAPFLWDELEKVEDPRKKKGKYGMSSIISGALFLFLFQQLPLFSGQLS